MLDYKDVPDSRAQRSRRRWAGPLMVIVALAVLIGGLAYLALDTVNVRSELEQKNERKPVQPKPPEKSDDAPSKKVVVEEEDASPNDDEPLTREPLPLVKPEKTTASEKPDETKDKSTNKATGTAAPETTTKKKRARKEVPPEPHYDFYTLLPQYEVEIPEEELHPPPPKPKPLQPVEVRPGFAYLLQVGSFRTEAQAEDTRGRLALLGFEASVHESTGSNNVHWFRVRLGPYAVQAELDDVRRLLLAEGFSALAIKVRIRN